MRFLTPCIILSLLTTLPLALSAPADTPATTTLLSLTPTLPSKFPHQTPYEGAYPDAHRCGDDERDEPWRGAPLDSEAGGTITEFVPETTAVDRK
ncbi:hypothetical protein VE04_07142 [Pseudogymnoascus sp. 24MN13]|nr:hypothetical protein VE04_07142 [Pseudogymnoascus sp. 24MN13]